MKEIIFNIPNTSYLHADLQLPSSTFALMKKKKLISGTERDINCHGGSGFYSKHNLDNRFLCNSTSPCPVSSALFYFPAVFAFVPIFLPPRLQTIRVKYCDSLKKKKE